MLLPTHVRGRERIGGGVALLPTAFRVRRPGARGEIADDGKIVSTLIHFHDGVILWVAASWWEKLEFSLRRENST